MFTLVCAWFLGAFLLVFYSSGQVSTLRALFLITHTIMPSKSFKSFKFSYQRDFGSADVLLIYKFSMLRMLVIILLQLIEQKYF